MVQDLSLVVRLFFAILAESWKDGSSLCLNSSEKVAFPAEAPHRDLLCCLSAGAPANSAVIRHVQQIRGESKIDL